MRGSRSQKRFWLLSSGPGAAARGGPNVGRLGVMFLYSGGIGIEALAEMMDDDARAVCDAVKPCRQACESAKSRTHDVWNQRHTDFQGGQPTSVPFQRDIIFVHQYGLIKSEILNLKS